MTAIVVEKKKLFVAKAIKKVGGGWERYIWSQYLTPRPETTRKQKVGETLTQHNGNQNKWNSRVGRFPSASALSSNYTPSRSVFTLNVCMIDR